MKKILSLFSCLLATMAAWAQTVVMTSDDGGVRTEVMQYGEHIARVVKYPSQLAPRPAKTSFSVVLGDEVKGKKKAQPAPSFGVAIADGCVTFTAPDGQVLLRETGRPEVTRIADGVDKGKYRVAQAFALDGDEAIFGLGQRKTPNLNQRGEKARIWSVNTYISIPYFTSEKGYGLYWDNAGLSQFEDNAGTASFTSEVSEMVDYYFIYDDGTQDGVMRGVRELSGQATMFPLWTLGLWQCRERYRSSDQLCEVVDTYRKLGIPLDGIVQDWQYWGCDSNWNAMRFQNPHYINKMDDPDFLRYLPDDEKGKGITNAESPRIKTPEQMVEYVHEQNAHLMISIWASFGPWTGQFKELQAIGALYPFDTWPRNKGVMPYDPFNPQARDIYWKYLKHLYDMDIDAWWSDGTEPDQFEQPGDMEHITYAGSWKAVKNAYPLLTNIGIYEHQRAAKGGDKKRAFQMTRCGAFGLQRSAAFNWSGDIQSSWEEFRVQVPSGLNYALCGIPFWNTDLGGFFHWDYRNDPHNPAQQELEVRWMQWGCFLPLMRRHCSSPMINEIYQFGSEGDWAYDVMKQYAKLRYRILPYSYSTAGAVVQNSETMMRPFVFDFPHDKRALNVSDEYLFGRSILVKPVTEPLYTYRDEKKNGHTIYPDIRQAAAPVDVYLPAGCDWYDFWTNEKKAGGRTVQRLCPIDIMPLYVKAGSIIPFGPEVQYTTEKPWDCLEVRVYPGQDGDFILYEDEGDNYNYEKGAFTQIRFHWDDAAQTLTIGDRSGKFKGMLTQRQFNVVIVNRHTPAGDQPAQGILVDYAGKQVTVKA